MRIGFVHSLLRKDDKLLLAELHRRPEVTVQRIDTRELAADLTNGRSTLDLEVSVALVRCLSFSRALNAVQLLEAAGVRCVNPAEVARCCGSKLETSLALRAHGVPQPEVRVALSAEAALGAIEELGYPVVLKPVIGSWGRLISRINDRHAAEALLEHQVAAGPPHSNLFYLQRWVDKGGSDIRAFVAGGRCIAAIERRSEHWITNTARGATVCNCPVNSELNELASAAARAVGGGVLAVDLFSTTDGLMVNEVNHTMEFKNSIAPTGVDIPAAVVDHVLAVGRGEDHVH